MLFLTIGKYYKKGVIFNRNIILLSYLLIFIRIKVNEQQNKTEIKWH
jgi:hypothetical protein